MQQADAEDYEPFKEKRVDVDATMPTSVSEALKIVSKSDVVYSQDAPPSPPQGAIPLLRFYAQKIVTNPLFDAFILCLILINSILLALYQYRVPDSDFNWASDNVIDPILLAFFTLECIFKIVAWGLFCAMSEGNLAYLCDAWNWLDFIVVVTGWVSLLADGGGFAFLRVFRVLRPLRSLTMLPEMRVLVNTILTSIPKLFNVILMGLFIFTVFAIIGITLWGGIFYRQCRSIPHPTVSFAGDCWIWNVSSPDESQMCGGRLDCPSGTFCGGHPSDPVERFRPLFDGISYEKGGHRGLPWCAMDQYGVRKPIETPPKAFPEQDFIHFDHIGGALLVIFQSMTMEGWTDIMYWVQDGNSDFAGSIYFVCVILITSFFMLNVILAVIDEALDQEEAEAEEEREEQEAEEEAAAAEAEAAAAQDDDAGGRLSIRKPEAPSMWRRASDWCTQRCCCSRKGGDKDKDKDTLPASQSHLNADSELWVDCALVRWAFAIADSEVCKYTILFFIAANVIVMMTDKFPPDLVVQEFAGYCEKIFLTVFGVEMALMLLAMGPVNYVKNPLTCFDGIIVMSSFVELLMSDGGALSIFRTFRLLRVVFKIANKWPAFRVLVKSIIKTIFSLGYFALLFFIVMYVLTLMGMTFFATKFHFEYTDSPEMHFKEGDNNGGIQIYVLAGGEDHPWCPGATGPGSPGDIGCIPRSHFDTFLWAFTTIFQIMSGENWNTVMYDAIRVDMFWGLAFFMIVILFGQTFMLNLFLTILMTKFDDASKSLEAEEQSRLEEKKEKRERAKAQKALSTMSGLRDLHCDFKAAAASGKEPRSIHADGSRVDGSSKASQQMLVAALAIAEESFLSTQSPHRKAKQSHCTSDQLRATGSAPEEDGTTMEANLPGQVGIVGATESAPVASAVETHAGSEQETNGTSKTTDKNGNEESVEKLALEYTNAQSPMAESSNSGPDMWQSSTMRKVWKEDKWPYTYSLLLFHDSNPVRRFCKDFVERKAFDYGILVCILISSTAMAIGNPLLDPEDTFTVMLKAMDKFFAVVFIFEMVLKLVAHGLVYGPNTYLHNSWNWIDGIVVIVSIIDMTSDSSAGFLKTLRILRAFRPLRVISRNENLKVVVTTIGEALPELAMYLTVFMLFLLILALLFLVYLNGLFYACTAGPGPDMGMAENMGADFVTPLCLSQEGGRVCPRGSIGTDGDWVTDQCTTSSLDWCPNADNIHWSRPSADTPICVGRCKTSQMTVDADPPADLCPREPQTVEELPSLCPFGELNLDPTPDSKYYDAELLGTRYVKAMMKEHVVPCSGPVAGAGCRDLFCPHKIGQTSESCKRECQQHPSFCYDSCEKVKSGWQSSKSTACEGCLQECEAWCECQDYCEPLIKDAALCVEQGERWGGTVSQNFNKIFNSLLTLIEISSTEGWVDVMYAAVDATGKLYEEPKRDTSLQWAIAFSLFIFFSNMFFLNLSVGVIVEEFLKVKKKAKMVNSDGNQVQKEVIEDDNMVDGYQTRYFCGQPLHKTGRGKTIDLSPASAASPNSDRVIDKKKRCTGQTPCEACKNFQPDPTLTTKQAQWLKSRKSLHNRLEPFQLTNLHLKPEMQRKAFLLICSPYFENGIMATIVMNTALMAAHTFDAPDWWDDFRKVAGYTFAFIFTVEFVIKLFALRRNYWKDAWNLFDFFCVVATFLGIILDLLGVPLGAVMSVIRIFRVARLFRLLRFMKGVNKIFMCLVYAIPKLANVSILLVLMLILYSILGVQLFAKVKFSGTLDVHGNFRDSYRAFITLFRAMTGEAWNEMMHDLAKTEKDYLLGPLIGDDKSWCSPANLWNTDEVHTYRVLEEKCMIEHPNMCGGFGFLPMAEIYFVSLFGFITCMVLNLVIAVILEGYEDGKEHTEGETIDACIRMWKTYDPNLTMFIPFQEAFRYADEVLQTLEFSAAQDDDHHDGKKKGKHSKEKESPPNLKDFLDKMATHGNLGAVDETNQTNSRPDLRTSSTSSVTTQGCFGMDLAVLPMKYAQAFDLKMTEEGKVHFIPVVKLVLRIMCTNNDPEVLAHIELADSILPENKRKELQRMESTQLQKNNADLKDCPSLQAQVAASKIQRRFKARLAKRKACNEIERRFGSQSLGGTMRSDCRMGQESASDLVAESCSSTPATAPDYQVAEGQAAGSSSASVEPLQDGARQLEPRNPADVDGLDQPGRWQAVGMSAGSAQDGSAVSPPGIVDPPSSNIMRDADVVVMNPPPGG
jgi:hypothetical protein